MLVGSIDGPIDSLGCVIHRFQLKFTDKKRRLRTDRPTDRPTETPSYSDASKNRLFCHSTPVNVMCSRSGILLYFVICVRLGFKN